MPLVWIAVCNPGGMSKTSIVGLYTASLFVVLSMTAASGQHKINFRIVEFGGGPAMVSIQDNDPYTLRYPKVSFVASGGLVYSLKRKLSFTTHAMFELKGGRMTRTFANESDPIAFNTYSSYITFAPGIRRYVGDSGFFLEGGPFVSFLLFSHNSRNGVRYGNPYAPLDAGLAASIGVTPRRILYKGLNMRLVNHFGLMDIDHHTGIKEFTYTASLIIGMRVRLR
jgi:hypothetical protein